MGDLEKLGGPLGWRALPIANVWLRHWALVKKKNATVSSSNCPTAPADPFRNFHMSWPGQRVGLLACPIFSGTGG